MNAEWFAVRLRELREQAGLSRKELAERAGLQSEAGIRNLEQGIRQPSWPMVIALCQALSVKPDAFVQEPAAEQAPPKLGRPKKTVEVDAKETTSAQPKKRKK